MHIIEVGVDMDLISISGFISLLSKYLLVMVGYINRFCFISMQTYNNILMCVCECVYTPDTFLSNSLACFLKESLSLTWRSPIWINWIHRKHQGSSCLCLANTGVKSVYQHAWHLIWLLGLILKQQAYFCTLLPGPPLWDLNITSHKVHSLVLGKKQKWKKSYSCLQINSY